MSVATAPMQRSGGVPSAPAELKARLAESHRDLPAAVSAVAAAVATYREAVSFVPVDAGDWRSLDDGLVELWATTPAGALRDDLDRLTAALALVDTPTEGETT
jgi:hypothetical protein